MKILKPNQWTASTDLYDNQMLVSGQPYWAMTAQKPWSVTNPSGDNNTLRFEVRPGDTWQQGDIGRGVNRSEMADVTHFSVGTDIHISYDWTIESGAAQTALWVTAGQLRQASNEPYSAPFGIMMSGEHMRIPIAEGGTSGTNFHDVYYDPQDLLRDHAYHMQINARFDPVNGHLDVSRDGVMLVNYDGPLGWENMGSVYWKEGVYRADTGNPLAMDYSNLSIGSGGVGGAAVVSIPGASGDDVLAGPADRPSNIRGYAGDDFITGGPLFNDINGNQGDDTIVGRSTVGDWLLGGQGQDSIDASASTGANVVNGNVGSDTIVGGSGADTLHGGKGDDVIRAGAGQAWISGDLGTNAIYGGGGMNTFDAGPGHDLVEGWHAGDHVQVDSGVTYTVTQVNAGVQINFSNGGEMDLLNTQLSSLQSGWIFQA